MEEDKFKDLLEDEELTALRLAALASKKKNELKNSESANALPINRIITGGTAASELQSNQIPFVQSDRSVHNNNYYWRNQNNPLRRRGGIFPKSSHRSNLIVISPITLNDGKGSEGKFPASLILPQHKWCNSGNEDSMSPKTLRRTGPTRFNRHGSDSESSDESDYDPSENDSGSNETILQDEPSEHFSHLSSGHDKLPDSVEKKRRLSFQSADSNIKPDTFDKNEATSVYKSLKNSFYDTQQLNDAFNNSDESNYNSCNARHMYSTKPTDSSEDLIFKQNNSNLGKGESCSSNAIASLNHSSDGIKIWQEKDANSSKEYYSKDAENSRNLKDVDERESLPSFIRMRNSKASAWQHGEELRTDSSLYSGKNQYVSADSRTFSDNCAKSHYLPKNDQGIELKNCMQEFKSEPTCNKTNESIENRTYSQYNSWDRNRGRYSRKDNEGDMPPGNPFDEAQGSSLHEANRMKQNFSRENDVEHSSNFNWQQESTRFESFSSKDKFESSFDSRRSRYDRSSSVDRNKHARSSSRSRRSERSSSRDRKRYERSSSRDRKRYERSSSRDRKRYERSSSRDKIKHNANSKLEGNLSPTRNKSEHQHNKSNDQEVTEERRAWYKSSPKENLEQSSSQDRSKCDHDSSVENKHDWSTSHDKDKSQYENNLSRSKDRHLLNSSHDRSRYEHGSSHSRKRRESSQSSDSRSEHSSLGKRRYSSSRDGSRNEHSSSDSESRYKYNSRAKFISDQHRNKHDITVNQKKNMKANEFDKSLVKEYNTLQDKKPKCAPNSEKLKDAELKKIDTKDQSKSFQRSRSERGNSKEKTEGNRKPLQKYSGVKSSYKKRYSRSRSSSSESRSSSYSSSSSQNYRPKIRSVTSVVKPVLKIETENKGNPSEKKSVGKNLSVATLQSSVHSVCTKRNSENAESSKLSNIKAGFTDGDSKASEGKRVPVHMRLGAFPRKRVIQMPKDVEAAFVNSSSSEDENVNTKCKKQNIRIVTDMFDAKSKIDLIPQKYPSEDKPVKRPSPDIHKEKFKRAKAQR